MSKPKGGRGYKAPYETHQVRVPDPIAPQIHQLIEIYQDYIQNGGDPTNPPTLNTFKPIDNFKEQLDQASNQLNKCGKLMQKAATILEESLKLKANAGGAIKREIEKAVLILKS